jgi:hypothetical protein
MELASKRSSAFSAKPDAFLACQLGFKRPPVTSARRPSATWVIIFDSHTQHLLHHVQHVAAFREAGSALEIRTPEAAAVGFSGRRLTGTRAGPASPSAAALKKMPRRLDAE